MLQLWLGGGGGGGGPTLLQTAGAAHHLTADLDGRCDPILPGPGRPSEGPSGHDGPKPTNQQTSDTGGGDKNNTQEAVETRLMRDGCLSSVFINHTVLLFFDLFLTEPVICH